VPAFAGDDEDDATRPHAMLAGMRTRAAKPAHAVSPPVPRPQPDRAAPEVDDRPADHELIVEQRRYTRLDRHSAYLSVV
jgi:hypothetical protein